MTGSDILIKTLGEHNVSHIFGYPGASILSVYESLQRSNIQHILTQGEIGACFSAEGYSRASTKTGVVLATSGPGATNLLTGLADAFMDSIPIVAITGNVDIHKLGSDSFQEVDIFNMSMPVTKYNIIAKSADEIAPALRKAFRLANSGRKGPVLVDIPSNVFDEFADYEPRTYAQPQKNTIIDRAQIQIAAEMIENAEHPVIYLGGGVKQSGAQAEATEFANKICAPVMVSYNAIGCFDPDHSKYIGILSDDNIVATNCLKECDLLIVVGARFNSRYTAFNLIKKHKIDIIQIDLDESENNKIIDTECFVRADIKFALREINKNISQVIYDYWAFRNLTEVEKHSDGIDMIRSLSRHFDKNTVVATDVGLHQVWACHNFKVNNPLNFLTSGGLGAMGFGLSALIGAYFATYKKCLLITGDGSFNMSMNELQTAVKYNVPMTIVIMNNSSLGMIRKLQMQKGKKSFMSALYYNTDYAKLADAMGAKGYTVKSKAELEALLATLKPTTPVVIDCQIAMNDGY